MSFKMDVQTAFASDKNYKIIIFKSKERTNKDFINGSKN